MIMDRIVWRTAVSLLKRYSFDASLVAAQRADELLSKSDIEGQRKWKRVVEAINELQRGVPVQGERVN